MSYLSNVVFVVIHFVFLICCLNLPAGISGAENFVARTKQSNIIPYGCDLYTCIAGSPWQVSVFHINKNFPRPFPKPAQYQRRILLYGEFLLKYLYALT